MPTKPIIADGIDISLKPLHSGVSVPNMDESIAWYSKVLGFTVESDMFVDPVNARIAFLKQGEFSIELFEPKEGKPLPGDRREPNLDIKTHGNKHVAYAVKDIRQYVDRLKSKQVEIAMDVFPMGEDLVCFIRDNSGNLIELIQQPE